jgi:acylphosphatase
MRTIQITVAGKVQGVWFRKYTKEKVEALGLNGSVENLADGSVFIIAQGVDSALDELIKWTSIGSPESIVETVEVNDVECEEMLNFQVKY